MNKFMIPVAVMLFKSVLIILGISILLSPSTLLAKNNVRAPNIVLIVADYMGYSDIEPYGSNDIKTPSLNTLASHGLLFSNHYSAASSCIPSRASLMSGKYPAKVLEGFKLGRGRGLHAKNNNLLNGLITSGYETALIGKWHLGAEKNFRPNDHGFDYFFGFNSWTLGYHTHLTSDGDPGLFRNKEPVIENGYLTDIFTDEAVQFIDKSADDPFFLYLSYNAGLPPYQAPDLPKPEWDSGWDANDASRADYIAMIERMDQGIGKVLSKLSEHEFEENTLVIFTYDHGGRHLVDSGPLFHGFGTLWEGGIRVPLIIRWPNKVKKQGVFNTPTIAMDLTATILDAVQANNAIDSLDGTSLLNIIEESDKFENRNLYWRDGKMKAIRKNNWKYVMDGYSQLLFNLEADISERNNVFHKNPKKVNELRQKLADWENDLDEH
ncbi:sulfatase-like hydrolase/transferase [Thalassotalea fonticola]|uniref:Sulfatase-like hydrolase/transferase n=1 Tax=Thalassotalea fonticola TaxID=3065649 RepID=A0ABZ0GNH9_9GAMM|nr:sulfatase-like hydrolase/transferase [Colwelliaceae bacterium S1-1]